VAFQSYLYFKKCKYLKKIRQTMMALAFYCAPTSGILLVHNQLRMVIKSKTIYINKMQNGKPNWH